MVLRSKKGTKPTTRCSRCDCSLWKQRLTASTMAWEWICYNCDAPHDPTHRNEAASRATITDEMTERSWRAAAAADRAFGANERAFIMANSLSSFIQESIIQKFQENHSDPSPTEIN